MRDKQDWCMGKVLAEQAARRGNQPFVRIGRAEETSYGQMDERANRLANGLAQRGVDRGTMVAVMLPNRIEHLYAWFGINRLGAVHVAINTAYKGVFLKHVLNNCEAEIILLAREYLPWLKEIEQKVLNLKTVISLDIASNAERLPAFERLQLLPFEALLEAPADPPTEEVHCRDIGAIMYTSGTTGPSKGVLMPNAHMYMMGQGLVENMQLTEQDIYYINMPLFHANGMFMQLYGTLQAGGRCMIAPGFSASSWLDDIRFSQATITNLLGVMVEFVYRQPERPEDKAHQLRGIVSIPSAPEMVSAWRKRFGVQLVEAYGMTEVNIPLYHPPERAPIAGSCGLPYQPYYEVKVVHPETDEELPPREVGEIVVRPLQPFTFMQGYYRMEDKTVESWRNLWFHTGDAAYRDEEGYFFFVDRIKDRIRRRGENISSYEVELVLGEHPAIAEVAAIAVKSEIMEGEDEIKVCVVLKTAAQVTPEALLDHCKGQMPYYSIPRYVEFVPALPKTPTEKVQKIKLREAGVNPQTWDRERTGYRVERD